MTDMIVLEFNSTHAGEALEGVDVKLVYLVDGQVQLLELTQVLEGSLRDDLQVVGGQVEGD
jgi:hypothetical protein